MRFPDSLQKTEFARTLEELTARKNTYIDLTASDVTEENWPVRRRMADILSWCARRTGQREYSPLPQGNLEARRAIARYYERRGANIDASNIYLTSSTSEAYSWLLKAHGEPGDSVLIPKPSYPLFRHLVQLEGLEPVEYRYTFEGNWRLEPESLRRANEKRDIGCILAVSPNNPTGNYLEENDLQLLIDAATASDAPLVVDEVFLDYSINRDGSSVLSRADSPDCSVFVLSGLSKVAGMPDAKLSWMCSPALPDEERRRLEYIADTYLSVSAAVQLAVPDVLSLTPAYQKRLKTRLAENTAALDSLIEPHDAIDVYPVAGGWYAILRFPAVIDESDIVIETLHNQDVKVYPGFLFDLEPNGHVVVSLLPEPTVFRRAIESLLNALPPENTTDRVTM